MRIVTLLCVCALSVCSAAWAVEISLGRARELVEKLPPDDPWLKTRDGSALAWGESYTLNALVDLYEASDDRFYLDEVARRGLRLLSHRDDRRGIADGSGHVRKAWSMALKYTVATANLTDARDQPVINVRSTAYGYNNVTSVSVRAREDGRFDLRVANSFYKREETIENVSLDPGDQRFVEKIVNHPRPGRSPQAGEFTTESELIRVQVVAAGPAIDQQVRLEPIPLAYMGYIGVIYHPLLRFAQIVKATPSLSDLDPVANQFITAAEESYADAQRLWRNGPNEGEGYYLTSEKGEPSTWDNIPQPFNYLARHTTSQLALHRLTGKDEYLDRARRMATLFRNRLQLVDDCYVWLYWYEPVTTTGWTRQEDRSVNVPEYEPVAHIEDTSHGALDVDMVALAYEAGVVFDKTDVQRFANTFLRNVLLPDRSGVRRRVDGQGDAHPPYHRSAARWINLATADPQVYHAIRKAYLIRGEDDLRWLAPLLKWERKLAGASSR